MAEQDRVFEIDTLISDRLLLSGLLALLGGAIAFGPELRQAFVRMRSTGFAAQEQETADAGCRAEAS